MEVLEILLQGIQNDVRQVGQLSQNLANANTPGYQRLEVFSQYVSAESGTQTVTQVPSNDSSIQHTGRNLDIAVTQEGFFAMDVDGQQLLSRFGRFHINQEGLLSHSSGAPVLGLAGPITLGEGEIQVNATGEVYENGVLVDQLLLLEPLDRQTLQPVGEHFYKADEVRPVTAQLVSGAVNKASANTSADMVRLIELSRHTQSMQKAVFALDQIKDAGINELGRR